MLKAGDSAHSLPLISPLPLTRSWLQDTQKDILDYAQQACDTFPAFKDQCVAYVETYGPVALATAIAYLQPALCQNIGFCPAPLPPVLQQQQQMSLTS